VGRAIGTELRALGITLNFAPVADIASRPWNPSLGIKSFGEAPAGGCHDCRHGGRQAVGRVAAIVKQFPGKGEAMVPTMGSRSSSSTSIGSRGSRSHRFGRE
jgi:beta-N-acetylhexosaminidase